MIISHEDLVRIVRELPERQLQIIDLAWKVVKEDGSIDQTRALIFIDDIERARQEARSYAATTERAVWALRDIARSMP